MTFVLVLFVPATALATTIQWATSGTGSAAAANALGEPGADTATATLGNPLTDSAFSDAVSYGQLTSILVASGVTPSAMAAMDFIALDLNGTTGGFEGASWSFDDGAGGTLSTSHNFGGLGAGILFNGDMTNANYQLLFGATSAFGFVGLILFDLSAQGIDVSAPGFSATLEGGADPIVDAPDPAGLGVIVPEPGILLLLWAAGFSLALSRAPGPVGGPRRGLT